MDKERLFRGKGVSDDEWIYGPLLVNRKIDAWYILVLIEIDEDGNEFEDGISRIVAHEVKKETVCECTDLLDCKKNRVYVGDIVKVLYSEKDRPDFENIETVEHVNNGFALATYIDDVIPMYRPIVLDFLNGRFPLSVKKIEVIGNIFDNPDLMKKEEDYDNGEDV